jgi:hypothetical protein
MSTKNTTEEAEPPALVTRPTNQQEKASRRDHPIGLLQGPEIRHTYIWRPASLNRAVNMLLACEEELPPALAAELKPYKEKPEALRLEASAGPGRRGGLRLCRARCRARHHRLRHPSRIGSCGHRPAS